MFIPKYTNHAKGRLNERDISREIVEWIMLFGETIFSHGSIKYYIPKKDIKFLRNEIPNFEKIKKELCKVIVVADDDTVITAMKKNKRILKS